MMILAGCERPENAPASGGGSAPAADSNTILIGQYGSLSGSEATFGTSTDKGVMLAINEINAAGGVKGKQLAVKTYDDRGKAADAGSAVTRLIESDKVVAIIGEVASSLSIAGGRVAQQKGVPMITPASTNPQVTEIGDMIFRVCFIDPFQGFVMAKFTRENLKLGKVAVLYDQKQAYSTGLRTNFTKAFNDLGGEIVADQAYNGGDSDFSAQLTRIRESGAEAIFLPGYYTDVANIAIQARKSGITIPFVGTDGWESDKLFENAGKELQGSYYSSHYTPEDPRPELQSFIEKFRKEHGRTPDAMSALGYDAAKVLAAALERAPSLAPKDVAAAIAATKDFPGVTGTITIDANRNATKAAVVLEIRDGAAKFVTSVEP